ncbi:MAG: hypothetical protein KDA51_08420, partial [Planctomycetales bacterium]|nr:hypothetical protein [Planctomycetales bacterium]
QGQPGEAEIYYPEQLVETAFVSQPKLEEPQPEEESEEEIEEEYDPVAEEPEEVEEVAEAVAEEPVAEEIEEEYEVEKPLPPPPKKPRSQPIRIEVIHQPEIDWLWYERNGDTPQTGWVDSEDNAADRSPPADLWWNRNQQQLVEER